MQSEEGDEEPDRGDNEERQTRYEGNLPILRYWNVQNWQEVNSLQMQIIEKLASRERLAFFIRLSETKQVFSASR